MWKELKHYNTDGSLEVYPNYEINEDGDIRNKSTGTLKSHQTKPNGYKIVPLYNESNKGSMRHIHRLVLSSFTEEVPHTYKQVDHIDRNKSNNCLSNLRWCTQSENSFNKSEEEIERVRQMGKEHLHKYRYLRTEAISIPVTIEYDGIVKDFKSIKDACDFLGVDNTSVSRRFKDKDELVMNFRCSIKKKVIFKKKK